MRINLRLHAALRERVGTDGFELELGAAATVADAKLEAARQRPELGELGHVRGVVGNRYVPDGTELEEGAELHLLPPVSGGTPEEDELLARGLFELADGPIDPGACLARVDDEDRRDPVGAGERGEQTGIVRQTQVAAKDK